MELESIDKLRDYAEDQIIQPHDVIEMIDSVSDEIDDKCIAYPLDKNGVPVKPGDLMYMEHLNLPLFAEVSAIGDGIFVEFRCGEVYGPFKCDEWEHVPDEGLKPCPLCGGKVRIILMGGDPDYWWQISRGVGSGGNCDCRLFLESEKFEVPCDPDSLEERKRLADKWNTRA